MKKSAKKPLPQVKLTLRREEIAVLTLPQLGQIASGYPTGSLMGRTCDIETKTI
jgi:hypothetical protein